MAEAHLPSFLAFFASLLSVRLLEKPARRYGLVDVPGGRKQHAGEIALIGGLVTLVGVLAALVFARKALGMHLPLLAGCVVLLITGIIDDHRDLKAEAKFLPQIAVALLMAWPADNSLLGLGNLVGLGPIDLGVFSIAVTVFAVVGVINALNMSDGMDGLAGGFALIGLAAFAYVASHLGLPIRFQMLTLFGGALAGFLVFNLRHPWRRQARIFLGDSGSMVLGFVLAWFAVDLSQGRHPTMTPVTALWILALPLMDTVSVMLRRMRKGLNPFAAGRDHLHHVLLHAGFTHCQVVWVLLLAGAALAALGVAGWQAGVPEPLMFGGFAALFGLYHVWGTGHAWRLAKWLRRMQRSLESEPVQAAVICPPRDNDPSH